jgi:hypothetical protein
VRRHLAGRRGPGELEQVETLEVGGVDADPGGDEVADENGLCSHLATGLFERNEQALSW